MSKTRLFIKKRLVLHISGLYGILYNMNLSQIKNGEYATVIQVSTEESIRQRLKMLNVYPSAKVRVVKRSLFKSSLLLEVNGVRLGLRRELAEQIKVIRLDI